VNQVARNGLVVHMSYTGWGWLHLALGTVNIFAGFGLFAGMTAARIWAIVVASISAIANLGFTSAYPVWVILIITLDVIIIYTLCVCTGKKPTVYELARPHLRREDPRLAGSTDRLGASRRRQVAQDVAHTRADRVE
jgi:fatty acid desaturase